MGMAEDMASRMGGAGWEPAPTGAVRVEDGRPAERGVEGCAVRGRGWLSPFARLADHPGRAAAVAALVSRGADPNEADCEGWTPLAMAARSGNAAMVSALMSEGADADRAGPAGLSALAVALGARVASKGAGGSRVGPGHIECAMLLAGRMRPGWGGLGDGGGWPPLARLYHSMARFERGWMGRLHAAGASVGAPIQGGWTLLRLAAEAGREACSVDLAVWAMALGADPGGACDAGVLPERAAARRGKPLLAELLRSARERGELAALVSGGPEGGAPQGGGRL